MVDRSRNIMFFLFSTSLMLGIAAYISFRIVEPSVLPLWLKNSLVLLIFFSSQSISCMRLLVTVAPVRKFGRALNHGLAQIFHRFWGQGPDHALGHSFIWMRVGGYISAQFMTLFSFVVIRDALLLFVWILNIVFPSTFFSALFHTCSSPGINALLLGGSVVFAAWGMKAALRVPQVRKLEINIPALPQELDGLRIAQLSDLHIGSTFDRRWLEQVVAGTNTLDPDLVLITGDLADGVPQMLYDDLLPLTDLKAQLGVFISVGNHEYYSGVMPWVQTWRDMGLTVLLNQHRVFEISGKPLIVAGIADPSAHRFPGLVLPDAKAALAGAPKGFSILMAHQPKDAREHAALGYNLQLSGHTHGGQYFFLFPLSMLLNRGYRSGLYDVGDMKLYVSPGTGMWGYVPMRVGAPSEMTLLTLRAGYR